MNADVLGIAKSIRDQLQASNARLVTAESCTAGRIAATLASIPGISQWLCGGFIVYRSGSKHAWLGIPTNILDDPAHGPVSPLTSDLLCRAALERTPEASWSLSITGEIGPGAPTSTDGHCFAAITCRSSSTIRRKQLILQNPPPVNSEDITGRIMRLEEATLQALEFLLEQLSLKA